jgi:hypothetical protein
MDVIGGKETRLSDLLSDFDLFGRGETFQHRGKSRIFFHTVVIV